MATGPSIARVYFEKTGKSVQGAAEVFALTHEGDKDALEIWNDAMGSIAIALKSYISLLAPSVIVLGGGVSKAGTGLVEPLVEKLEGSLTWQRMPKILTSNLGDLATCIGASILARSCFTRTIA